MFFKNKGILGINARNLLYIKPYNKKKAVRMADDKIKTKQFLSTRGIPVPKLYGVIKDQNELEKFDFTSLSSSFVLKPNKGFGGEGIIPIVDQRDKHYITASGKQLSKSDLKDHIRDILDGMYSISNVGDCAFFEQHIVADERIGKYAHEGLPDIRVVVHNLIPVMAMLRLPTKESDGKANLHLGAVGVGIDIAKGEATFITKENKIIDELPDGLGKIQGLKIPYWDEILLTSSKVQLITNLGYMAVDICIDKNSGPVLLEINARAGLGVQIANLAPLRKRLERIEGVKVTNPTKGVRIAKDMFGNIVEKEIESLSGKQVIGTDEEIEVIQKQGTFKVAARIDTSKEISVIDEDLALKKGLLESTENYDDEKSSLKLKFSLKNKRLQTIMDVEKFINKDYKVILGSRDLKEFLIDTSTEKDAQEKTKKTQKKPEIKKKKDQVNYNKIDQLLIGIDSKIKLLYHLRPLNLESEKEKFFSNPLYNPQFEYPKLKFDPIELIDDLNKIKTDDSDLGKIFEEKKKEILNKIKLIETMGEYEFSNISVELFGKPDQEDINKCLELLKEIDLESIKKEKAIYSAKDAQEKFEKTFEKYGLKSWKVKLKETMVADCVAGKNNRLFIKEDAKFTSERIEALIVHEIETHILTAENGKMQVYEIFNRGLANYLTTQEGLAMYNVEKQRKTPFSQNYKAMSHVICIHECLRGSFADAFQKLREIGIPENQAFRSCLKAKRGFYDTSKKGAFTKDYIYFKGYDQVKNYIDQGGDIKDLYIGKMDVKDVARVKAIPIIREAKILPDWLKK